MNISALTRCLLRQSLISSALAHSCSKYYSVAGTSQLLSKTFSRKLLRIPQQQVFTPLLNARQQKDGLVQHRNMADSSTSAVTIWDDLKQMRHSPVPALVFGFAGLIPFVLPPVCMILKSTFHTELALAQTAYGACILAFLGGVRWGFVLPEGSKLKADWFNLGYSVTPSLLAWAALLFSPPISNLVIMTGLAGTAYFDTAIKGYPPWFKGMRFVLSLGAVLSLWTVLMCRYLLSTPEEMSPQLKEEQQ